MKGNRDGSKGQSVKSSLRQNIFSSFQTTEQEMSGNGINSFSAKKIKQNSVHFTFWKH